MTLESINAALAEVSRRERRSFTLAIAAYLQDDGYLWLPGSNVGQFERVQLPADTFKSSGTGVSTRLVIIDRPEEPAPDPEPSPTVEEVARELAQHVAENRDRVEIEYAMKSA